MQKRILFKIIVLKISFNDFIKDIIEAMKTDKDKTNSSNSKKKLIVGKPLDLQCFNSSSSSRSRL